MPSRARKRSSPLSPEGSPLPAPRRTSSPVEPFDPDDPPAEWRYFLYPLTDEELAEEREWHRKFQK